VSDFRLVCEQHMAELLAFFSYRLGSRADAEDLTQETLERALRAWSRYDPGRASARTWLLSIARNLLIDHFRASGHRRTSMLPDEPEIAAADAEPAIGLDPDLAAALARLPDRERELVALRYGADLSGPEIAALTGLSLANVQQILSRTLRWLRSELEPARGVARAPAREAHLVRSRGTQLANGPHPPSPAATSASTAAPRSTQAPTRSQS
jgi:RNA polymerase sigma factor (sigma-70 family)